MLLSPRKNSRTSLFKEVRVFKVCSSSEVLILGFPGRKKKEACPQRWVWAPPPFQDHSAELWEPSSTLQSQQVLLLFSLFFPPGNSQNNGINNDLDPPPRSPCRVPPKRACLLLVPLASPKHRLNLVNLSPFTCCFRRLFRRSFTFSSGSGLRLKTQRVKTSENLSEESNLPRRF